MGLNMFSAIGWIGKAKVMESTAVGGQYLSRLQSPHEPPHAGRRQHYRHLSRRARQSVSRLRSIRRTTWAPPTPYPSGNLLYSFRIRLRSRPRSLPRAPRGRRHRRHHSHRTQPRSPRPPSLFFSLGDRLQPNPRLGIRSRPLSHSRFRIRHRFRRPRNPRTGRRLLSRHASVPRLRSLAPSSNYAPPLLGNHRPHRRLHRHRPGLQPLGPPHRPPLAFLHPSRPRNRLSHRSRRNCKSLHRVLRRQPPRATPRSLRHRPNPLWLHSAISTVLARVARCSPNLARTYA